MDKVLHIISDYVSTCTSCRMGYEGRCGFIVPNPPVSTDNNPYDHEAYRKLTHEQRAFRNERDCTHPCDEQVPFAAIIDNVEEALEKVTVDFDTKTLLRLLTKMNNMVKSIERQPMYLWFAFEDIVLACIERCIAHIDYNFLEAKIDIEEAILSVFPEYNRQYALCIAHPEAFVKTYLSQATKISLDRIMSHHTDLRVIIQEIAEADSIAENIFDPGKKTVEIPINIEPTDNPVVSDEIDDEDFSFNFVRCSGVKEVDRIFRLIIKENPEYPDEVFREDIKTFRKKCEDIANHEEDLEKKEAWVVAVINVLAETYFSFSINDHKIICDRVIDFWGVLEGTFMRAHNQFCVKRLALELAVDDILTTPSPESLAAHQQPDADPRLNPMTLVELAIYKELGPTIGYCERKICKNCDLTDCPFRWGNKRMYYEELEDDEVENQPVEAKTKAERSLKKLSDDRIDTLLKHLAKIGYCILGGDFKYIWLKDQDTYAYFCYKLSDIFVGAQAQLETKFICTSIICSRYNPETTGRYARQYRKNEKCRPELADQLDHLIQEAFLRHL